MAARSSLRGQKRLPVFPVILGSGKKLFGEMDNKKSMRLISSQTVGEGLEILIYETTQG
jgi:hypothetical protein